MEFKPVKDEGVNKLYFSRENLESLVRESRMIRATRPERNFYDNDFHAIQRLQDEFGFLITNIEELKKDDKITFAGKFLEDGILSDEKIEIVIKDLEHNTSIRFAYAVYQLAKKNNQMYGQILKKSSSYNYRQDIENYFREKLSKYLKK